MVECMLKVYIVLIRNQLELSMSTRADLHDTVWTTLDVHVSFDLLRLITMQNWISLFVLV